VVDRWSIAGQAAVLVLLAATAGTGIVSSDLFTRMKGHNVATLSREVVERQGAYLVDFLSRGEPTCPDQYTLHKASRYPTTTCISARLGGDEFAVFITEAEESKIVGIASRIQQTLAATNSAAGRRYRFSFSTGIVSAGNPKTSDLETLLAMADKRM
jgi:hypothetical protein